MVTNVRTNPMHRGIPYVDESALSTNTLDVSEERPLIRRSPPKPSKMRALL